MSVYLRAAIVALLVALGFLAGRFTNAPQAGARRAGDLS